MSDQPRNSNSPPLGCSPEVEDTVAAVRSKPRILSWQRLTTPSALLIGTTAFGNVLRVANTMILTRLLMPSDFGLAGMILSIFFVVAMVTDVGFLPFVVRHERGDEPRFLDAVWSFHASRGLINCVLVMVLSVPISNALGKPQLAPLLAVSALTLAIDGCASLTPLTALRRGLVRRLSAVDFGFYIAQVVVGIVAAVHFRSAWALVIALLAGSLFKTAASYAIFPDSRRRLFFDRGVGRELWIFSRPIAASSLLTLLIAQVDKLVLARFFTLADFGIFVIASNLAGAPTGIIGIYVPRILYPQIARAWRTDPGSIQSHYYASRGIVFFGYLAGVGGMIGAGPLLIRMLYDPRYAGAGIFLCLLAVASAWTMITRSMQDSLVAIDQTRTTLMMNVMRLIWLAVAGPISFISFGAIGLVGVLAFIEIPAYLYGIWVMRRLRLLSARHELLALSVILGAAAAGFALQAVGDRFFK